MKRGVLLGEGSGNLLQGNLRLHNVTKTYTVGNATIYALNAVELSVQEGELICVVGPSGSGKSTLLYLAAGLEQCSEGEIYIGNVKINALNEDELSVFRRHHLGFVFQSFNLLPHLSALENVELPLFFARMGAKERRWHAEELLRLVGLANRMEHKPGELSGGEQQRVSIARALVGDPPILLADEPTGNLDTKTGEEILSILVKFNRQRGKTVIIATHDLDVTKYAHRVVMLRDGRIQEIRQQEVG